MANRTRSELSTDSLGYFPNNNSQLISPQDLRDWITNGIESFVTQKDKSRFENAFYENKGSNITAASTTNLSLATGNFIHIQGTTTITSFGNLDAGARFILMFQDAANIQASANLIIPGTASGNIRVATPGDCCLIVSEGGGAWRIVGYFVAGGAGSGTITGVTAGTGLSGGGTSGNVTLNLANTTVTPAAYTNANITVDAQGRITAASSGSGITDGDKGDITVSGSGSTWTVDANAITYGKIQNASGSSLLLGSNASGTGITEISLGSNLSMTGSTLNATGGGGGGGTPGGADGQIQYNNGLTAFGGVSDLTWDDVNSVLTINTPRIGQSNGNGHFHMHSATSVPPGITDYLTIFWQKATRVLGFKNENESFRTFLQFLQPTADRTYTFPDSDGNVVLDTFSQTLSNKTLASPEVSGIANFKNGTSPGQIRLFEGSGSGTNYTGFVSPTTLAGNLPLTLPSDSGTSGYVLQTDGSGNLSWVNNGGTVYGSFILNTTETNVTGTLAETINKTILIPANTFTVQAGARFIARMRRDNISFNVVTNRMYVNTSPSTLTGATLIGSFQWIVNAGTGCKFERSIIIIAPTSLTAFNLVTLNNSYTDASSGGTYSTAAIDWSQNQYIIITTQNNSTNAAYNSWVRSIQVVPE